MDYTSGSQNLHAILIDIYAFIRYHSFVGDSLYVNLKRMEGAVTPPFFGIGFIIGQKIDGDNKVQDKLCFVVSISLFDGDINLQIFGNFSRL